MSGSIRGLLAQILCHGKNPLLMSFRENRIRPPGAVEEKRFMALCIRCNRCLEVCPYHSIKRAPLGLTIGTPYIFAETKACYLCMACSRLCPTGALDTRLRNPERVAMGKAKIDASICYSHLFLEHDVLPAGSGNYIGATCNTCYHVCPFPDKAITLKDNLFPVVLDGCVGCGICVERCPVRPRRAINVTPAGMGRIDEAGFYFRKARKHYEGTVTSRMEISPKAFKGEELLERKAKIEAAPDKPQFRYPYEIQKEIEGWE